MHNSRSRHATTGFCPGRVIGAALLAALVAVATVPTRLAAAQAAHKDHVVTPQSQVDAVAKSYLAVQKLLAQDKTEGVAAELKKIQDAATKLGESGDEKVKTQAKAVAKQADVKFKDLKEARTAFKGLSSSVIALVKIMPPTSDVSPVLYEATCPMVRANWLQGTKEIVNPYMGSEMLDCGKVERKIEPTAKTKG
jgi:hypothetical protein